MITLKTVKHKNKSTFERVTTEQRTRGGSVCEAVVLCVRPVRSDYLDIMAIFLTSRECCAMCGLSEGEDVHQSKVREYTW